ncbi:MAG: hypothetical protein GXO88_10125 [Chlorobi bacterium]|nr:hypothetical protein [Chlorobiota bacterium]
MRKLLFLIIAGTIIPCFNIAAQDVTTVEAKSVDISENLDLEAIASVFGEAKDLEDFEKKLNDPELQISNLDLNGDGKVDYLRVVETSEKNTHLIAIQAVIGNDQFQDVATVEVEKDEKGETRVQVVGDVYMYGPNYIVQPVYVSPPVIFMFFWGPLYHPWHSPYYWGYYPPYYHPWRPHPTPYYRSNVHLSINVNNSYHRTSVRYSNNAVNLQKQVKRNDYARANPGNSFQKRNKGLKNSNELQRDRNKKAKPAARPGNNDSRPVNKDWKPSGDRKAKPATTNKKAGNKPANKPNTTKPSQKPALTKPAHKPTQKPAATKPAQRPSQRPATTKPASKPGGTHKPAARPTNTYRTKPSPAKKSRPKARRR